MAFREDESAAFYCCHDCGYPLNGLDTRECPECGREFDPADPVTYRRTLIQPVELCRVPIIVAPGLCDRLEAAHIATVAQPVMGGIIAHFDLPQSIVYVEKDDLERAREFLKQPQPDMARVPGEDWVCPACHEQIGACFDVCWNCSRARSD